MEAVLPKSSVVLKSLLRADYTTQWRNRRSVILTVIVPLVILISWKDIIAQMGGEFALSSVITVGLMAIGLMGYSNSIARDRDKGIFQRLRVAPIPSATIMMSRLAVQLTMIMIVTVGVFLVGYYVDHIRISALGYFLTFFAALIGGAVYLSLGQAIVGMITNPETVNSTTRLVYFLFIMVGMLGEFGVLGAEIKNIIHWSPYGAVRIILFGCLKQNLDGEFGMALAVTLAYIAIFATLGIQKFKWSTR
jgi:ABC-2 type transport system permease protein